ncbi:MAG: hypothetical protein V1918_05480 [Planctomycetota bacterium]
MSIGKIVGLILSVLLFLDGAVCLVFLSRVEPMVRRVLPRLNVKTLATVELLVGVVTALVLYLL